MANPTDLQGMLTSQLLQPQAQAAIPSTYEQRMLQQGQKFATGLRRGIGAMTGSDTRSTAEKAQAMMANLDINDPNDQPKILQLVNSINPAQTPKLVSAFAQQQRQRDEKQSGIDAKNKDRKKFAEYLDKTYPNKGYGALALQGLITPENMKNFIKEAKSGSFLKGTTFTVKDEKGNKFTMTPVLNKDTGNLENKYSPIGNAPAKPVGNTTVTGGEFALTPEEDTAKKVGRKAGETEEKTYAQLRVEAVDSISTLSTSKDNLEKATSLLDSVETGGPINIAATGLQNFFGVKSADKAQLEIILGNEMYKSLKPLFGGIISDSESARIERIYATLSKGNIANKGILKQLKKQLDDSLLKAHLYENADTFEEYRAIVKQMFPKTDGTKKTRVIWDDMQ